MPAKHLSILSVRLPEADVRRFKSQAAQRGVSLQAAVHQALEAWASDEPHSPPQPFESLKGSLANVDVFGMLRDEKDAEKQKELDRDLNRVSA